MQPHLYDGDRPSGPQMFAEVSGARSTGPFDPGVSVVSVQGNPPDYVLGTDWKKQMGWPEKRAQASAPGESARDDAPAPREPAVYARTTYEEPPRPAPTYPSLGPAAVNAEAAANSDDATPTITG